MASNPEDWVDALSDTERRQWDRFVRHARRDAVPKIKGSAFVMSLVPTTGEADVKFAVELGFGIMHNKPIVLVSMPSVKIPPGLRRIAHHVIELEHDIDTEEGSAEMRKKLRFAMWALGLECPDDELPL